MRGLAYRRNQKKKSKCKAKKIAKEWRVNPSPKRIGMISSTPKSCSCHMCGNPRKHWKQKTIQEIKADEAFHVNLKDLTE